MSPEKSSNEKKSYLPSIFLKIIVFFLLFVFFINSENASKCPQILFAIGL